MRTQARTALLAIALLGGPATVHAQAGLIAAPENPGSGVIADPENPGSGVIADPENPGSGVIADPENPGSGVIADPENPGSGADTAPVNPTPSWTTSPPDHPPTGLPRAVFRGSFASRAAVDMQRDDESEETVVLDQQLDLRVRYRLTDRWTATLEGRLTWWMSGAGALERPPIVPDPERWQGRVRPELGDAFIAGRAGPWLFRFGQQAVVWGATDLTRPGDVIHPRDLTRGLTTRPSDARIPVPALEATRTLRRGAWQMVFVPFFVPNRIDVVGGDAGIGSSVAVLLGEAPAAIVEALFLDAALVDPSLDDLISPLLLQTELPEETPGNVSAGTRLTYSSGGVDLGLGVFYGWDRTPRWAISAEAFELLAALADGALTGLDDLEALQGALGPLAGGDRLVRGRYDRLLSTVVDAVTYAGPIGIRAELVAQPERTVYTATLAGIRRPTLTGALGLSYENGDGSFVVSVEGYWQESFLRASDGAALLDLDRVVAVLGGVQLSLEAFERARDTRWSDLSLQLGGLVLAETGDAAIAPSIAWSVTDRLELSTGAEWVIAPSQEVTVGRLFDARDAWWVRVQRSF